MKPAVLIAAMMVVSLGWLFRIFAPPSLSPRPGAPSRATGDSGVGKLVLLPPEAPSIVIEDDLFQLQSMIRNTGSETAQIYGIEPGCGCTAVTVSSKNIRTGESALVRFSVNPTAENGKVVHYRLEDGFVDVTPSCRLNGVFIGHEGISGTTSIAAAESLRLPIRVEGGVLKCNDIATFETHILRRLRLSKFGDFSNYAISCETIGVIAHLSDDSANSDALLILEVEFQPRLLPPRFLPNVNSTVWLSVSADDAMHRRVTVRVPVQLTLRSEIRTEPRRVLAGPLLRGGVMERTIQFSSQNSNFGTITTVEMLNAVEGVQVVGHQPAENGVQLRLNVAARPTGTESFEVPFRVFGSESSETRIVHVPFTVVIRAGESIR